VEAATVSPHSIDPSTCGVASAVTGDDVQDILRIVDGMQVDRLHLRTGGFELSLRRGDDRERTQSTPTTAGPRLDPSEPQEQSAPDARAAPEVETPAARAGVIKVCILRTRRVSGTVAETCVHEGAFAEQGAVLDVHRRDSGRGAP
jgi:biotin carboxyl carrier protein